MDEQFKALLSVSLVPQIIRIIIDKESVDENTALNWFYESKTYDSLSDEETKMWHYSPLMIYHIWKKEKETGEVIYPEGI